MRGRGLLLKWLGCVCVVLGLALPLRMGLAQEAVSVEEDWRLVLVNEEHALAEDYEVELMEMRNNFYVDERIYEDLQAMFDDARSVGIYPLIVSAYRGADEQQAIIDERVNNYMAQGMSWEAAYDETMKTVAEPGYSEHETGLAVDINAEDSADQAVYDWLAVNAHFYGFIVRYPANKVEETGIDYEPWHFRYVGVEHATAIYENDLSLEAYLERLLAEEETASGVDEADAEGTADTEDDEAVGAVEAGQ